MPRACTLKWVLIVALVTATGVFAAQTPADSETEAKQAADEDAEARKDPKHTNTEYSGTLTLFTAEQRAEYEGIVGVLARGTINHLVKLNDPKIEDELKPFDHKTCTVFGRLRNEGKYIVVVRVILPGAPNDFSGRRGGL